jgi:hypothetical protein
MREKAAMFLFSDFRYDTAKASGGMDAMNADTFVAAFARVRWNWRKKAREVTDKAGLNYDQNERTNFRRLYELWLSCVADGGKKMSFRNYELYDTVFLPYFDLPDGVVRIKK